MRTRYRSDGYTLIELLVVLAIVAILAGVGLNFSISRPSAAVRSVTNDMYGALQSAQNLARNSGRNVALQASGTESAKTLILQYGFFVQKADGTDDFTKGPGTTPQNPVLGSFQIDQNLSRYAQVADAASAQFSAAAPSPDPSSDTVLKALESGAFWGNNANMLFTGANSPPSPAVFYFQPDGRPSSDFFVPIVGVRSGVVSKGLPVGLILASRTSGLLGFLKTTGNDASISWQRL